MKVQRSCHGAFLGSSLRAAVVATMAMPATAARENADVAVKTECAAWVVSVIVIADGVATRKDRGGPCHCGELCRRQRCVRKLEEQRAFPFHSRSRPRSAATLPSVRWTAETKTTNILLGRMHKTPRSHFHDGARLQTISFHRSGVSVSRGSINPSISSNRGGRRTRSGLTLA